MSLRTWFAAIAAIQFFVVLLAPSTACAEEETLKALHRAYVGYTFGDGKIRTMSYDETTQVTGEKEPQSVQHVKRGGLVFRIDTDSTKENTTYYGGFTGNVFWYADENGQTTRLTGNEIFPIYGEDLVWTDAITTLPWSHRDYAQDGGVRLDIVRVTLNGGMPIDVYVDTATGAFKRIVIDSGGDYEEDVRIDSYAEPQPGLHIPDKWHFNGSRSTQLRSKFQINPILEDSAFHPPAAGVQWTFGSDAPIPMELTKERIVIAATVNGVVGHFLLDTGADSMYLTGDFARRAKIVATGHAFASTLYGTEKTDLGKATIQVGDNILKDATIYYGMRGFDNEGPDGLLGYGLFASTNLSIDFDAKTFSITNADQPVLPSDAIRLDASFGDGQPSIPMVLEGRVHADVILDTGDPEGVVFPYHLVPEYGLHLAPGKHGAGMTCGDLDSLTLGTFVYQSPYGCASTGGGRWVLAGLDFLRTFHRVDFNYRTGTIVFYPKKKN